MNFIKNVILKKGDSGFWWHFFFATARKRISIIFAGHLQQAVRSGQLLYRDAYKLTSLKGDTFNKFFPNAV
jgi:hypothetical protein